VTQLAEENQVSADTVVEKAAPYSRNYYPPAPTMDVTLILAAEQRRVGPIPAFVDTGANGTLCCYVLLYSMLSANSYSSKYTDGHYLWCVANLNEQHVGIMLTNILQEIYSVVLFN